MRKQKRVTCDDIAGEIYEGFKGKTDVEVLLACSGDVAHLEIYTKGGRSFVVQVLETYPVLSEEEKADQSALWKRIEEKLKVTEGD